MNLQSIKLRLLVLGAALILVSVLVRQFVALPLFHERVRELVAGEQFAIATYVARDIDHSIVARQDLMARLAAEMPPELVEQPDRLRAWLAEQQRANLLFNGGLMAVRPQGNGVFAASPGLPADIVFDQGEARWLAAALAGRKPVMGRPTRGHLSADPFIVFAAPVREAGGRVVTVLAGVALLTAPGFLADMQQTRLGDSGGFLLVAPAEHLIVGASDPRMILMPTAPAGLNRLYDRAMAGYRGTGITVDASGVEELSTMVDVPSAGWFLQAHLPTAEAFRPVEALRGFTIKASALSLGAILVILLYAMRCILRPLSDAARALRGMAGRQGTLAKLPVLRNDEVGDLIKGFNVLVDRLHREEAGRAASEARLTFMAHHDCLTGLYNRAMLENRLEQALARTERDGSQIALLFCDLDGFKAINDQWGHSVGDAVLRQVALRLAEGRRRVDTVARLGGDEFVILLTGLDDARTAATTVAGQCLAVFALPFQVENNTLVLGISIGIALHQGAAVTPAYLVGLADVAMYRAKRNGKGSYFFADQADPVDQAGPAAAAPPA